MKTRRRNDELKKASKHLFYEIWMLNETSKIGSENTVKNNAYIESFGIHARCVLYFLRDETKKDDMLATDFVENPQEWKEYIREKSEVLSNILKNLNKRVNKELAHLTYARLEVKPEEKGWGRREIAKEINTLFKEFLERVPKERFCNEIIEFEKSI